MPCMSIKVRVAQPLDYQAIGDLTAAAYLAVEGMMDDDKEFYLSELRDVEARANSSEILVAIDGQDRVLASVAFVGDTSSEMAEWDEPDVAGFRMLAVSPDAQGQGLGALLTEACIERARTAGKKAVLLHTTEHMRVAHRLYEKLRFCRHESIDIDLGHTLLMGYRLDLN